MEFVKGGVDLVVGSSVSGFVSSNGGFDVYVIGWRNRLFGDVVCVVYFFIVFYCRFGNLE